MTNVSILSGASKLRSLLGREEKIKCLFIVMFAVAVSLLEVATASVIVIFAQVLNDPLIAQRYFTRLGFEHALSPGRLVLYTAILVGSVYLVKNLVAALEVFYQNFTLQRMNYTFKRNLLSRYARVDYGQYLTRNSSYGVNLVSSEVEHIFTTGMVSLAGAMSESLVFLGLMVMVIYMNPSVALAIAGMAVVFGYLIVKYVLPVFYNFGLQNQEISIYFTQYILQFFHGFKEIVLMGKRDAFVQAFDRYSQKRSRIVALQTSLNALPRMVIEVLFVGIFVTIVGLLCLEQETPAAMLGLMGGYLYLGFRLMPGLNRIINQLNSFKTSIPYIQRVYKETTTTMAQDRYQDVPGLCFEKSIDVNGVAFSYPNTTRLAVSGISFSIAKGECIGIVGETGSGKSTLVDLLLGLLRPTEGTILVDEKYPVNAYQWHQKIGYVPQSIYLIDDTIAANIAFGEEEIDYDKLDKVIAAAQLKKLVSELPMGSKTIVGERGIRLSGGERQRIAIARALYRDPEVLIFDEATSALDHETEAKLMETIHSVSQNRTVIMIAHRLTTLRDCHRIIRLAKGRVEAITNYQQLQDRISSHG